jgi:hypothetical protein
MDKTERQLAEAIKTMFQNDPDVLGIAHGKPHFPTDDPHHRFTHLYESTNNLFALKINEADLNHYESLCSAFYDIHSYTYVTDCDKFCRNFTMRCRSMAVPTGEVEKACEIIHKISESICEEHGDERSSGWTDIAKMRDVTTMADRRTPTKEPPFTGGGPAPDPNEIKSRKLV